MRSRPAPHCFLSSPLSLTSPPNPPYHDDALAIDDWLTRLVAGRATRWLLSARGWGLLGEGELVDGLGFGDVGWGVGGFVAEGVGFFDEACSLGDDVAFPVLAGV